MNSSENEYGTFIAGLGYGMFLTILIIALINFDDTQRHITLLIIGGLITLLLVSLMILKCVKTHEQNIVAHIPLPPI